MSFAHKKTFSAELYLTSCKMGRKSAKQAKAKKPGQAGARARREQKEQEGT
jgi:hypothetical protein